MVPRFHSGVIFGLSAHIFLIELIMYGTRQFFFVAKNNAFAFSKMQIFLLDLPNLQKTNRHHMALCEPVPIDLGH